MKGKSPGNLYGGRGAKRPYFYAEYGNTDENERMISDGFRTSAGTV